MKTIAYSKSENVPPIISNPFVASSAEVKVLFQGHSAIIDTGLKLELYDEMCPIVVGNKRSDIYVINVLMLDGEIKLAVTPEGESDVYFIQPGEELASIKLVKISDEKLRFVDYTNGKRKIYGDNEAIKK